MNPEISAPATLLSHEQEHFLAELTQASYSVALNHGFPGNFVNVQLDLWAALRGVVHEYIQSRKAPLLTFPNIIEYLGVRINRDEHRAYYQGRELMLTPTEFRLLDFLIQHPGRVFTRRELLFPAVGDAAVTLRTIDVHVKTLRRKLGDPELIATVRGIGYSIRNELKEEGEPSFSPEILAFSGS